MKFLGSILLCAQFSFALNNFPFLFKTMKIRQPGRPGSALGEVVVQHGTEDWFCAGDVESVLWEA